MWLQILETSGSGEDVLRICNVIGETHDMKNLTQCFQVAKQENGINSNNLSSNYNNV